MVGTAPTFYDARDTRADAMRAGSDDPASPTHCSHLFEVLDHVDVALPALDRNLSGTGFAKKDMLKLK
jgi:hypothetical protein